MLGEFQLTSCPDGAKPGVSPNRRWRQPV
jgi:hypothetical protein